MAKVENLNHTPLLMDLVVNENRRVDQLAHTRPFANGVPHAREPAEQIHVIQQSLAKAGSGLAVVPCDMPNDLGQIV